MGTSSPRRRLALLLGSTLTASLLLVSVGTTVTAGAGTVKIDVCHLDRTAGTYQLITVASKSAHPKLPKGDYLAGERLAGETIYAVAWTETDGVTGFSGCENLIAALVENSDDTAPSAGDKGILGKYPTAFIAPFGFTSFVAGEFTVANVEGCSSAGLGVTDTSGLVAGWGRSEGEAFGWGDLLTDPFPAGTVLLQDNVGGGAAVNFTDRIFSPPADVATKGDEGNNPWLEISINCGS